MSNVLELKDLHVSYGDGSVLRGVSLYVERGTITALLGPNGSGKTTTLRAISNIFVQRRGSIIFDGREISALSTEDTVAAGIAHIPDGRGTFKTLTVDENLALGAYTRKSKTETSKDQEVVFNYFPRLRERRWQQAGTLSGGEQQMLAIARALMQRPKLLLLDEPSFGLAPLIVKDIFEMLSKISREQGMSMLLVEQNANVALDVATHAFVLDEGTIAIAGTAEKVRENDAVRQAYLGVH